MNIIASYNNGNTHIDLYDDGSKVRSYEGSPVPSFPESLDVKITNYCDAGCSYCHEQSTESGQHGDLVKLANVLNVLPAGVEIALGGGNPLSHPSLVPFLRALKRQGLICNITINQKHLRSYQELILNLITEDLVKGIGISYSSSGYLTDIIPIIKASSNVVFHVIMGINSLNDIEELNKFCLKNDRECKILILGYKYFGFGINYYLKNKKIEDNKYNWHTKLPTYFKQNNLILSFDNLAIEQLKLRRFFTNESWSKFFMGNDFVFTMYIDGIEQNYSPTSTSKDRVPFNSITLIEYFQKYRNDK